MAAAVSMFFELKALALRTLIAVLIAIVLASSAVAKSTNLRGVIFTLDANPVQMVWTNALEQLAISPSLLAFRPLNRE